MLAKLEIAVTQIREDICDITGKSTECVVCVISPDTECLIASGKFIEFLRFEQKKLERRGSPGQQHHSSSHTNE